MRLYYSILFAFLTACSAYGPSQNPWSSQNQASQYPYGQGNPNDPNNPYGQRNPNDPNNPYGQRNPNDPNNPYGQRNPNDPNNPYGQRNPNDPNNPYSPGNSNKPYHSSNVFNPNDQGGPPLNPFPDEREGVSRVNDLPYELLPDTISALTCEQSMSFDQRRYYTFSVGSHRPPYGGLRLSEDFIRNNRIDRQTPYQKVQQLIDASPLKRAMAQISIRSEHNINTIYSDNNNPILDYFPRFDNPDSLYKLSQQETSFSTRSSSSRSVYNSGKFQAFLPIRGNSFIHIANGLEENTLGDSLITLLYSLGNHNPIYGSNGRAYGRSYKLAFSNSHKADYLTNIYEENLQNSKREGRWECPIRFMVHRAVRDDQSLFNKYHEKYAGSIPEDLLPEGFCYTGKPRLTSLERDFFVQEFGTSDPNRLPFWVGTTFIWEKEEGGETAYDMEYPCIVPKTGSCYPTKGFYRVEFDPQENCSDRVFRLANRYGQDPKEVDYYKVCPAFLSVCYRVGD